MMLIDHETIVVLLFALSAASIAGAVFIAAREPRKRSASGLQRVVAQRLLSIASAGVIAIIALLQHHVAR